MSGKDSKSRDFDHLIEQNSTELRFLSAYGGLDYRSDRLNRYILCNQTIHQRWRSEIFRIQ